MKVLLTGGAGYIGSHTIVEMVRAGHEVVVVDNFSNSSRKSVERVEEILGCKIPLYEADVADEAALDRIFAEALKTQPEAQYYSRDGVHLNPNGAAFVGKLWADAVRDIL